MTFELIESPSQQEVMAGGFPQAAIQRTQSHDYYYEGKKYPGVTGILDVIDKSGPLIPWASGQTADAFLDLLGEDDKPPHVVLDKMLETVGRAGVKRAVTSRSSWKRDEAAKLGSEIHGMADMIVTGQDTPYMTPDALERVMRYTEWWKASGWRLRLSEALVVNPTAGYGGTFDLLAYDPDGKTVLADIKTGGKYGRDVYDTEILQLAAYGMAEFVAPMGSETAYPMPAIDRYVVLHLPQEGVREIEIHVGAAERQAFLACCDLAGWRKTLKGRGM